MHTRTACLSCGGTARNWQRLAARPCEGWSEELPVLLAAMLASAAALDQAGAHRGIPGDRKTAIGRFSNGP
eukprot:73720-Lingulodinium_polyedra.AAC.1